MAIPTNGSTGVVIDGLFLSNSKPKAGDKGLLVNNKFFIPFAESSGGGSADFYKCASVDTEAKTWSGYKAIIDSETEIWTFEEIVTSDGLTFNHLTPYVGNVYDSSCTFQATGYFEGDGTFFLEQIMTTVRENEEKTTIVTRETFGSINSSQTYWGGVLASDGKIYCTPAAATSVMEIDPVNDTFTTFGNFSSSFGKWQGGALAPNGKIYCVPGSQNTILEIDPVNKTTTTFPSKANGYIGAVLALNGKIYCIPQTSSSVLEIDPVNKIATTFGSLGSSGDKCAGGVLAPNGKIYGIPSGSSTVLEIDPVNKIATTFGSLGSSGDKWSGGVLAPNGKIYGIPSSATSILEIDPVNKIATTFGSISDGTWRGGVLAPNGKIYGIPLRSGSTSLLEIDPENHTVTKVGDLSQDEKYCGGVLAPNGKIYGIPYLSTSILKISIGEGFKNFNESVLKSGFLNKF